MPKTRFSRREILHRAGGAGLLMLPLLRERQALAQSRRPLRFVAMFFPNGVPSRGPQLPARANDIAFPDEVNGAWSWNGKVSEPLAPYQTDLSFHRNVIVMGGRRPKGSHVGAGISFLTGTGGLNHPSVDDHTPTNASLDHHIATAWNTPLLHLGLNSGGKRSDRVSWEASDRFIRPEVDAAKAYMAVFGAYVARCRGNTGTSMPPVPAAEDRTARERKLVLDTLVTELRDARRIFGLGAEERFKLERYEQALSEMEKKIGALPVDAADPGATCREPPKLTLSDSALPAKSKLFMDIAVAALELGLRRVVTYQMFHQGNSQNYSGFLPVASKGHHPITHDEYAEKYSDAFKITRWHHEQLAYLLGKMRDVKEGESNLLANSLVLWGTDTYDHNYNHPHPVFIAGRAGGRWKARVAPNSSSPRQYVELLATIAQALEVDPSYFRKINRYQKDITEFLA